MKSLAVIIPYFQRKPAILRRAVASVLAQDLPAETRVRIVIVDDGSPVAADDEVAGLLIGAPFSLEIVRQDNQGVAAARDTGLKRTDASVEAIAFLDSDDFWSPGHLARALSALSSGYDLYFTDHRRLDHHASHFAVIGFPVAADIAAGTVRDIGADRCEIEAGTLFSFALRRFTAQISTVVYRRALHPGAAFLHALRTAGEDRLFLLDLFQRCARVCVSLRTDVTCAEGVNIYYSQFGWQDEGHIRRHMSDILGTYALRDSLDLSPADRRFLRTRLASFRRGFAFFTLRWRLKRRGAWSDELVALTRRDPSFWRWYLPCLAYVAVLYPLRLYRPA